MTSRTGPTIRLKLTLLYGALFLVAGLILIAITYGLVRRELSPPLRGPVNQLVERGDDESDDIDDEDPDERENRARREERSFALHQLWRQSLFALLITGTGALGLGWLVAGRVLDPIRAITEHAQRASAATLGDRIALQGPTDELKALADTIDAMLDRIQAAFEAQRGFAAQASHELRTPLAIIRAEAEVARGRPDLTADERATLDAVLTATHRSEALVDGLLALSRSESTMLDMTALDLAEITGDVVGEYVTEAAEAGVRLDLDLEGAPVTGDRSLLTRMVGNLVQNGIRYNRADGRVDVLAGVRDGAALLRVTNTGPVIPQVEIDSLFRPFARGSWARRNRPGHGLGLAIVQSVATAHGGAVAARPGADGGLEITVRLPLRSPQGRSAGMSGTGQPRSMGNGS